MSLKERTEATESLATLHLAQRRNELVSFDLMLTVISINVAFFGGVASICGMNLWLGGSSAPKASTPLHGGTVKYAVIMCVNIVIVWTYLQCFVLHICCAVMHDSTLLD